MKRLLIILITIVSLYSQNGDCPANDICTSSGLLCQVDVIDELNATNNGCLAVNEGNTSCWIRLCALTAGTIQFTINPVGNVDYDWAVWQGNNCPPTGMPIRCSFAIPFAGANGDQTGCNSTNNAPEVDNSEGAFGNNWTQNIVAAAGQCYIICVNRYSAAGSDAFTFTLGGTAILDCGALPVELLDFQLSSKEGNINIEWSTSSEINNSHFIIQKDIYNPTNIGRIEGNGYSNSMVNYSIVDKYPEIGLNYYRLIQYDFNGDSTIYDWKSIYMDQTDICCKEYYDLSGRKVDFNNVVPGIYIGITNNDKVIKVKK